jgi:predicted GTPase
MSAEIFADFADQCRRKIEDFENTIVRCGIIGVSGSGKSTLLNAIAGEKIAETDVIETTFEKQDYRHGGIIFSDLPGCGTEKWPRDTYIEKLQLLEYDCFFLVTADRFRDHDISLFRELSSHGKKCFVIRSQFDITILKSSLGRKNTGLEESESSLRKKIYDNIESQLKDSCPKKIYLTSGHHPTEYDLPELLIDIVESLKGLKQQRFTADMATLSRETLQKKSDFLRGRIPLYAGLSAANGLNPIPGLDVAADVGILIQFGNEVLHTYGLSGEQFEFIKRYLDVDKIPALVAKIGQFAAKYLAKEGITQIIKSIAGRTVAKSASKWIPFVGPLISAGIGWQSTFMLAEDLVQEGESLAREILEEIIRNSAVE